MWFIEVDDGLTMVKSWALLIMGSDWLIVGDANEQ